MGTSSSKESNFHENLTKKERGSLEERYDIGEKLHKGKTTKIHVIRNKLNQGKKRGSFGRYKKQNQDLQYLKTESKPYALKLYDGQSENKPDLLEEAKMLRRLDHPNIVKLFATLTKIKKQPSLVLELCNGGDLNSRYPYTEERISSILRQLLSAVVYLHNKHIIHRDINVTNILFETSEKDSEIKLVDFGCAKELATRDGKIQYLSEKTGNVYVMAPEVIKGRYSLRADMWSVGVVAYMLIQQGKRPFDGKTTEEIERRILSSVAYYNDWKCSKTTIDFVEHLLIASPYRSCAKEAMEHSWIKQSQPKIPRLSNELVASLQLYARYSPIKRMALNVLARKASLEKIGPYRKLFRDLDTTHGGVLTKEEFVTGFRKEISGFSDDELKDLFTKLDINCNGELMLTEFLAATMETSPITELELKDAFDQLDVDSTGSISKKNILKVMGNSSVDIREDLDKAMKHDGEKLTFDKFKEFFGIIDRDIMKITEVSLTPEQLEFILPPASNGNNSNNEGNKQ